MTGALQTALTHGQNRSLITVQSCQLLLHLYNMFAIGTDWPKMVGNRFCQILHFLHQLFMLNSDWLKPIRRLILVRIFISKTCSRWVWYNYEPVGDQFCQPVQVMWTALVAKIRRDESKKYILSSSLCTVEILQQKSYISSAILHFTNAYFVIFHHLL